MTPASLIRSLSWSGSGRGNACHYPQPQHTLYLFHQKLGMPKERILSESIRDEHRGGTGPQFYWSGLHRLSYVLLQEPNYCLSCVDLLHRDEHHCILCIGTYQNIFGKWGAETEKDFLPLSKPVIHHSLMGPRILPLKLLLRDELSSYIAFAGPEEFDILLNEAGVDQVTTFTVHTEACQFGWGKSLSKPGSLASKIDILLFVNSFISSIASGGCCSYSSLGSFRYCLHWMHLRAWVLET